MLILITSVIILSGCADKATAPEEETFIDSIRIYFKGLNDCNEVEYTIQINPGIDVYGITNLFDEEYLFGEATQVKVTLNDCQFASFRVYLNDVIYYEHNFIYSTTIEWTDVFYPQ